MLEAVDPQKYIVVRDLTIGRGVMSVGSSPDIRMSARELRDLQHLAGVMVPADLTCAVPGADDELIFADIVRSLGRDTGAVRAALQMLQEIVGEDFSSLDAEHAEAAMLKLLGRDAPVVKVLGRVVLQCYYRDDRVLRSLGLELRAPFPKGHSLEDGDWSLLDPVKSRARKLREVG